MELIQIKKSFRSGKITHYLLIEDGLTEYEIQEMIGDWAQADSCGAEYGYAVEYQKVKNKKIILEESKKKRKNLLATIEENKAKLAQLDKFIMTL